MPEIPPPIEPEPKTPSEVLGEQLRLVREGRRWSQQEIVNRLRDELGLEVSRPTITRTEDGRRRPTLDEALALAAVLNMAPVYLFLPMSARLTDRIVIGPDLIVSAGAARRWFRGQQPLPGRDAQTFYSEVSDDDYIAMQDGTIRFLLAQVQELVDATVAGDRDKMADIVERINANLEQHRR